MRNRRDEIYKEDTGGTHIPLFSRKVSVLLFVGRIKASQVLLGFFINMEQGWSRNGTWKDRRISNGRYNNDRWIDTRIEHGMMIKYKPVKVYILIITKMRKLFTKRTYSYIRSLIFCMVLRW